MKTLHLNIAAGVLAALCLATLGVTLRERQQAVALNRAVAAPGRSATVGEDARITLARGLMMARDGDHANAQKVLQQALQHGDPALQNLARYDLGNQALRQALKMGSADEKLPAMLELAKQQYRDALLREPANLAVRYNLERALWLAPEEGIAQPGKDQNTSREFEEAKSNEDTKDDKEQATTTMKNEAGGLP
ncbi:MAG: MxaK protein [Herminiimonas sp.]|nr:MxaK protein [Herminiimonas sp.]